METALRRMSVEDFLAWDDGTDRRYELIDGEPVMMAPPRKWHRRILRNLSWLFAERLAAPWEAEPEAGIRLPHRSDRCYYVADIAVTAAPETGNDQWTDDPILIIEILSPETRHRDRRRKLPDYACLPSVLEIVLVSTDTRLVKVWRGLADGTWPVEGERYRDIVLFKSVEVTATLDEIYRGTAS